MKYKLGICLSGGGARGIAHVGVLKALEEYHIYPEAISGASAGSIVGAFYASGMKPNQMLALAKDSSFFKVVSRGLSLPKKGITGHYYLRQVLKDHIKKDSFGRLKKKLFISVVNLVTGKEEMWSKGSLFDAVVASSSIPLLFEPVEIKGGLYVDGGLIDNLPVRPLRAICETVIGVNVMPHSIVPKHRLGGIKEVAIRCMDLTAWINTKPKKALCDIYIEPEKVQHINVLDFSKPELAYQIGYDAALKHIPEILSKTLI